MPSRHRPRPRPGCSARSRKTAREPLPRNRAPLDTATRGRHLPLAAKKPLIRPPENRAPKPSEAENCFPYLQWQLNKVKPEVVLLLGATAAKHFLKNEKATNMKDLVGNFFELPEYPVIRFLLFYHPAFLLRDPRKKKDMWDHIQGLRQFADDLRKKSKVKA